DRCRAGGVPDRRIGQYAPQGGCVSVHGRERDRLVIQPVMFGGEVFRGGTHLVQGAGRDTAHQLSAPSISAINRSTVRFCRASSSRDSPTIRLARSVAIAPISPRNCATT